MRPGGIRYANMGIGVAFAIMAVGVFVLKDAGEAALQALGIGALLAALAVYLFLYERAKRRHRRDQ